MMTSPFEALSWGSAVAQTQPGDENTVSKLVFASIGTPEGMEPGSAAQAQLEASFNEQIAALQLQLRTQKQTAAVQLEDARQNARTERQGELEAALEARLIAERADLLSVSAQFAKERSLYFTAVEVEVVKLSLAIATRILHREAQMDPLLLAGVVRVALEKIQGDGETLLRVPAKDLEVWMSRFSIGTTAFTIIPDEHLQTGTCLLETPVGTVDFGVEIQLAEIERGFFDLLQQRPA
jgi:flagellar assembly protein FliH